MSFLGFTYWLLRKAVVMGIYIIAECGICHNGDLNIAKKMIAVAKKAGCNAVKFQKRTIDAVYTKEFLDSKRESPWGHTQREQKEGLEFGEKEYREIDAYCKEVGIDWFASAWDLESLRFLRAFDLKYNKIASAMIVDRDFVKAVAKEGRYAFIATGMSDYGMIDEAVGIFRKANCPFELMHCISIYPMPEEKANLKCIDTLRSRYKCDVGYSGHESGLAISYAAAALGISSLERHITLDRTMYGSDQAASIEPIGLEMLVGAVRKIELAMGDGIRRYDKDEIGSALKLRERYYGHVEEGEGV
jgi:N-acetylneuraminate synthase